jgi:hypothetical protein
MSALRAPSQIGPRIKYLLTIAAYDPPEPEGDIDPGDSALTFDNGYPGAVVVEGSVVANYVDFAAGELLKDLGRQITLVDSAGKHLALYREVQRVNGASTEGVGGLVDPADGPYGTFFVEVWSADGQGVKVVRVG